MYPRWRRAAKADEFANVAVNVEANGASAKPPAPSKAPEEAPQPESEEPVELLDPAEARCSRHPQALLLCILFNVLKKPTYRGHLIYAFARSLLGC